MNTDKIMVSVYCLVYNHEKYLRRCLDGFVNQKTNFNYEVIVHDDASTDASASIIREYEEKYPDIIKPIYQSKNQFSQKIKITSTFIYPRLRGNYIAVCEGDDYWCDMGKLQKQVDVLKKHPKCCLCLNCVQDIAEDGHVLNRTKPYKNLKSGIIPQRRFIKLAVDFNFQLSGAMFTKGVFSKWMENDYEYKQVAPVGDAPLWLHCAISGDVYYLEEIMSCYRNQANGSWSVRTNNPEKMRLHTQNMIQMYQKFDEYTNNRFHELCRYASVPNEYYCALNDKNYKKLCQPRFRRELKKESLKSQVYIYLMGIISILLQDKMEKYYGRK